MFLYSSISTLMMISRYRIGTGLRANPVGGQGVIKLITQHVIGKRKLTAVCSHQTRIGNLDAHLI